MIEWIEVQNSRGRHKDCDVCVTISKAKDKRQTCFTFYNDTFRRITNGDYIKIGTSSDRIYFAESRNGYKLSNFGKKDSSRTVKVRAVLPDFVGGYKLQFDAYEKCYCICKDNKKVE